MRLSGALLALCIVPLCASGANAQAPSPWPTSPQQAPAAPQMAPAAPMQGGFSSPQPGGFSAPQQQQQQGQQQMPPCVQEFFKLRDDAEKKAAAIKAANERKAPPKEACVLFTALAASQTKMLKFVNENGQWCRSRRTSPSRSSWAPRRSPRSAQRFVRWPRRRSAPRARV